MKRRTVEGRGSGWSLLLPIFSMHSHDFEHTNGTSSPSTKVVGVYRYTINAEDFLRPNFASESHRKSHTPAQLRQTRPTRNNMIT
jgi:hypothetical protein